MSNSIEDMPIRIAKRCIIKYEWAVAHTRGGGHAGTCPPLAISGVRDRRKKRR